MHNYVIAVACTYSQECKSNTSVSCRQSHFGYVAVYITIVMECLWQPAKKFASHTISVEYSCV